MYLGDEHIETGVLVVPPKLVDILFGAECLAVVLDVIEVEIVLSRPPEPRRTPQQLVLLQQRTNQSAQSVIFDASKLM